MVLSILDNKDDDAPPKRRGEITGIIDTARAPIGSPAPPTNCDPDQGWTDEQQPIAYPEPPRTQLDGRQRVDPDVGYRSVYEDNLYRPDEGAENIRRSGLAWSAGVVFFGSVVFMLFIGWGADLLFGSSPWGLVLGIVLGSVIGFIQFFRISSQIYQTKKSGPPIRP